MAASRSTHLFPPKQGTASRFRQAAEAVWWAYIKWYNRRAAANYLRSLDDRMLDDIGVSRTRIQSAIRSGRSLQQM